LPKSVCYTFCLDAKSIKKIKPGPMLPDLIGTGQANAHEQSLYFVIALFIELVG